jgi:hypothetical protein
MGEGEGGGGQNEDLLGPPSPLSPPTEWRGDFLEIFQRKVKIILQI